MAGLGKVSEGQGLFLSIAGGFIWNRKADASDPDYAEQTYVKVDKSRYADLTGRVVGVRFRTHDEYGESINVTIDADGERYIISISTNSRYSTSMMKALLNADLSKDLFIKPYDFEGKDKKRAMGISFRQGGEKLELRVNNAPTKEADWFKNASKKEIKRFFEDLGDWFVAEVETKVVPQMDADLPPTEKPKKGLGSSNGTEAAKPADEVTKETNTPKEVKTTPLKMKKALKAYIAENYEGQELPKLPAAELVEWYNLCLQEELPWPEADENTSAEESNVDEQLSNLLGDS